MAVAPGPLQAAAEQQHKFHKDVERLARLICDELGLAPHAIVYCRQPDHLTPYEDKYGAALRSSNEMVVTVSVQRWETFRRQAALLLAGQRALHRFLLES